MQHCWREILVGTWPTHVVRWSYDIRACDGCKGKPRLCLNCLNNNPLKLLFHYYTVYRLYNEYQSKQYTQLLLKVSQFLMCTKYYSKIEHRLFIFFLFYFHLLWTFERIEKYVKTRRLHRFDESKRTLGYNHNNISFHAVDTVVIVRYLVHGGERVQN